MKKFLKATAVNLFMAFDIILIAWALIFPDIFVKKSAIVIDFINGHGSSINYAYATNIFLFSFFLQFLERIFQKEKAIDASGKHFLID